MNHLMYRHPQFPLIPYMIPQRHNVADEEDLATVALQIQKKRFYVDVKKNWRGRFMKIAEVGMDGRKARILLTMTAADNLKEKLKDLADVYDNIVKQESEILHTIPNDQGDKLSDSNGDGLIKSHIISYPHRRYYLDLKKNRRGYFLRLTMLSTTARIKLAVPAQGIRELYNSISDLLKVWWNRNPIDQKELNLPEPKSIRIDNRTLYFDSISNQYGIFLRISQVWATSRTAITIPSRSLNQFRDIINELADNISNSSLKNEIVVKNTVAETDPLIDDFPSTEGSPILEVSPPTEYSPILEIPISDPLTD